MRRERKRKPKPKQQPGDVVSVKLPEQDALRLYGVREMWVQTMPVPDRPLNAPTPPQHAVRWGTVDDG